VKHWQPHCTVGCDRQTVQTAAAAVGMINAVGSLAGFASPYLFGYLNTRMGSFSYGLAVMMVAALAGGLLMLNR
jgi:nitrate/nitrite transporter NarK